MDIIAWLIWVVFERFCIFEITSNKCGIHNHIEKMNYTKSSYPGGTKARVNLAGNRVREDHQTFEDVQIIDEWRAAHRAVLNTFQAILRTRTRNKDIIVAQRHKRRRTIYDKLIRFPQMQLSRMDDVAGCRLIFTSIEELYEFRKQIHSARFKHKRKNEIDKYDYIKHPKITGYRGIHDVYSYDVRSIYGQNLQGLLIEIQFRTLIQHAWATTVEIIGFITENQPKFQRGDKRYETAMLLASEILARSYEDCLGPLPELDNRELVEKFLTLDAEIHLLRTLKGLNQTDTHINKNKNAILIFKESGELEVKSFKDATEALRTLFRLEKEIPHDDIVLVRADTTDEVRMAFKNYFSDARDFIELIEKGCQILCGITTRGE
jgi:ppGpp synthetase/RelA/SpoT-type nucleotidyltranferase